MESPSDGLETDSSASGTARGRARVWQADGEGRVKNRENWPAPDARLVLRSHRVTPAGKSLRGRALRPSRLLPWLAPAPELQESP